MKCLTSVRLFFAVVSCFGLVYGPVWAQTAVAETSVNTWLLRMHEASGHRAYSGTFVVSAGGSMASAKIWHVCDGTQQMERVESLSGTPRAIFRRNAHVVTFFPQSKVAVVEQRESLGLFPNLLKSNDTDIGQLYQLKVQGTERVAGFDADVLQLRPKDNLRYGYRIWSEKKTGLVIQLQTLDLHGQVIEQAAFSELQLDAAVSMGTLSQMMDNTQGYRLERPDLQKTTANRLGWAMHKVVPGFKPVGCYERPVVASAKASNAVVKPMQWMFSDGLATVSLFVETFDRHNHVREGVTEMGGVTHILTQRMGDWWLTVVGEVPSSTLGLFAQGLERAK